MKHRASPAALGFTLIELMITVSVMAVLATVAAPSFTRLLSELRVRTTSYNLIGDLILARNEAVKRGGNAVLAVNPVSSDWALGWSLVATTTTTTIDPVTHIQTMTTSTADVAKRGPIGNGVVFLNQPSSITFGSDGRSTSGVVTKFTVTNGMGRSVCISLGPSGLPKSVNGACV